MARVYPLLAGLIFGAGLVLSGMTQPAKVIGFLDVAGAWDPSLAFVMVGAIAVYASIYHAYVRRVPELQLMASLIPSARFDPKLVLGALIFGVGWGMGGFCPGPGLVALGSGQTAALVFAGSMLAGMLVFRLYEARTKA